MPKYSIKGAAGAKYSCLVPQKVHHFPGLGIHNVNVDELTLKDADVLYEKTKNFLALNEEPKQPEAASGKTESKTIDKK